MLGLGDDLLNDPEFTCVADDRERERDGAALYFGHINRLQRLAIRFLTRVKPNFRLFQLIDLKLQ